MKIQCIFLMLMSVPIFLSADILEIEHLRDIKCSIHPCHRAETLVVFDIDNTLLEAVEHLGSVAWGDSVVRDLQSKGISEGETQEVASVFWRAVQPYIKIKAVDKEVGQIIHDIQAQGVGVMCLTARMPQELSCTLKQLHSIGLNINAAAPGVESKEITTLDRRAFYNEGILFATPFNKKSEVFMAFLKENKLHYKRVIFVDDKMSHVKDLNEALEREGIDCVAIRFSGADKHVRRFNPAIAEYQWKRFQRK